MKGRKFGIKDLFTWGFMAAALILLGLSLSVSRIPVNTEREASKAENAIGKRMALLEKYISNNLQADKKEWMGRYDLPEDMVIYRYIDDSLQSWSNQFPVKNDDISSRVVFQRFSRPRENITSPLAEVTEEVSFVNYGEKWYLVKSETLGIRKVIAGLEIIDQMDDDNPHGVNKHLKLRRNYTVVPLAESGGSTVSLDGKPVFKVTSDSLTGNRAGSHSALIWLAIACFVLASLLHLSSKRTLKRLLSVLAGLFAVMIAAYIWGGNISNTSKLFSPTIYADGQMFNSLGAVLIVSLIIILSIGCLFVTRYDLYRRMLRARKPRLTMWLYSAAILLILVGVAAFIHLTFRSIILNSNISLELYRLNDLNIFSLLVYVTLICLLLTVPLLVLMIVPVLKRLTGLKADIFSTAGRAGTAALFAAYMVITAGILGFRKEQDRVNVLANRLSMERDISLELGLRMQEEMVAADQFIANWAGIRNSNYIILNRLLENSLSRLAQDYDIQVELFPENEKDQNAIAYFTDMVTGGTAIAEGSRFRYRRDSNGHSFYTGSFAYYNAGTGVTMMLLTVSPKSNREDRGYARILGYSAPGDVLMPAKYSYAKYSGDKLSSYKGNYAYPTVLDPDTKTEILGSPSGVLRLNDYTHFINILQDEDLIIISRQKTGNANYLVAFLFLTLVFYFCLSTLSLFRNRNKPKENNYYKTRINLAMMVALIMTLIALAAVSVLFVYRRNNANLRYSMSDKINALQTLLEARCRFASDYTAFNTQEAAGVLEDISSTMKTDITLYTTGGKEFRSTTPEVFERMLLGTRMNQKAFENIIYKNRRYYIGREDIGSRPTYFLYAPVFNGQGKMIAIMSAPYTDESFDFKSEAVRHSITIFTVFMILLLLARFITERAVDKMFKPLSEMGRKMNEASIDNLEYIVYERDDEVSSLVRAYNLMVHDLYDSTMQMTQTERDKAWATMARMVAHEIKNPLTPIKLQIQRLIRMKNNGNPAWAERFDEVSEEVLRQIDILSDTANEFSTLAKLYSEEPVEINLDKLLKEEVDLFDCRENIRFEYRGLDGAMVSGPKPQLTRVFTNLLGNAVQAIESIQEDARENDGETFVGRILVSLRRSGKEGFYDIVFEDNGPGVSDENRSKLFTPNFTTKNNGTGLGLAICRTIVEKCNGEISYSKSFSLKGACFTVRLPRMK